jgi:HEAT repeat protein
LIQALLDKDDVVRIAAADALGRLGDSQAKEPLLPLLKDPNAGVRTAAACALGSFGDLSVGEELLPLLRDPNWETRVAALESLGRLRDPRATEAVIACLRDPDREVREKAAECLGLIGDHRAVAPLLEALLDSDRFVRQWARLALQRINPQWERSEEARARLELFRTAAASGDYGVQFSAREVLRSLGEPAGGVSQVRRSRGGAGVMELLTDFLADPDPSVRQAAVEALVALPEAAPRIKRMRQDPDPGVAAAAAAGAAAQPAKRPTAYCSPSS